jgi:hypothetical protein
MYLIIYMLEKLCLLTASYATLLRAPLGGFEL